MKPILLLLVAALALGGCSPTRYCKPGASTADFEREKRRCMNEAAAYSNNWGAQGNPFIIAGEAQRCLEVEYGWQRCAE